MSEVWKEVPGYEGIYAVSNLGAVKRVERMGSKGKLLKEKMLSQATTKKGYKYVFLKGKFHTVHSLVLTVFVGVRPEGLQGCHNNANPADNRLGNLRWDTNAQNQADKVAHGNSNRGTKCPNSKLSESEVFAIRVAFEEGKTDGEIGKCFGVSSTCIKHIRQGKSWSWLIGS